MAVKVQLADRLYLPDTPAVRERVDRLYKIGLYKEIGCKKCSFKAERPCDQCEGCPNNEGTLTLWKTATIQGRDKIGVPVGDRVLLKRLVGKTQLDIEDKRSRPAMRAPIKLTRNLYPYQEQAVKDLIRKGYGILQSPPRSGKTFMAAATSIKIGLRTLIVAAQMDWLDQFEKEYRETTNINDLEEQLGRKLIGQCKTVEEMRGLDIVLCTYQTFLERWGKERLNAIKRMFGTVICDEVHDGAAMGYAKVLAAFHARYRFGLSATPRRKDGRMHIVFKIVGPVVAKTEVEAMTPRVQVVETPAKPKQQYKTWNGAMNFLFNHKKRNQLIVAHAVHDIKQGRSILIPTTQVKHAKLLTDMINAKFGEPVAVMFAGKMLQRKKQRKELLQMAREGKFKCIVGSRKVVQVGLNIPIMSVLYNVAPISNEPKYEQETKRVCTKMEGKPEPLIKHFIDPGLKQAITSFTTCYMQTYKALKFTISPETEKKAKAYIASGRFSLSTPIRFGNHSGGIV